jgi:hypothetical protein
MIGRKVIFLSPKRIQFASRRARHFCLAIHGMTAAATNAADKRDLTLFR